MRKIFHNGISNFKSLLPHKENAKLIIKKEIKQIYSVLDCSILQQKSSCTLDFIANLNYSIKFICSRVANETTTFCLALIRLEALLSHESEVKL